MLAPWQRLDAINTLLYPALHHLMRTGTVSKTVWTRLDEALRPLIKRSLYLPQSAANDYLYGSGRAGACGIRCATETRCLSGRLCIQAADLAKPRGRPTGSGRPNGNCEGEAAARVRPARRGAVSVGPQGGRVPSTRDATAERVDGGEEGIGTTQRVLEAGTGGSKHHSREPNNSPRGRSKVMRSLRFQLAQQKDVRLHALRASPPTQVDPTS
ncbi:unnamed protein product [Ixodes hexagonus]